jgi:hypothetical protein
MTAYALSTLHALRRRSGKAWEDILELYTERLAMRLEDETQSEQDAETGALADCRRIVAAITEHSNAKG